MEFKDLIVYKKSLEITAELEAKVLVLTNLDKSLKDQLKRASTSITLNISEGSSRFSPADRKNYFVVARGSAFIRCEPSRYNSIEKVNTYHVNSIQVTPTEFYR
jgi:hypothetical protein